MTKTIIPSIYRISIDKVMSFNTSSEVVATHNAHTLIKQYHQKRIDDGVSSAKGFELLSTQQIGEYQATIYGTASDMREHPWTHLFPEAIENLEVKYPNLAAFFSSGDKCYAISSGMGHTFFEQFIDTSFPLEVARHIMSPKLNSTAERDITGAVYGRAQQFRTSQLIVSSQNLGTIWQAITGQISEEVKSRTDFSSIFNPTLAKIAVDAGSALKIRKSVEINKLVQVFTWVDKVLSEDISTEQVEAFKFLNGLKEINPRKDASLIQDIKNSMATQIRTAIIAGENIDFDFSHRYFINYQSAEKYEFEGDAETSWPYPPSVEEVFEDMKNDGLLPAVDATDLLSALDSTYFLAVSNDELNSTRGSILDHLHGEVEHDSKHYFLVDGKFYVAEDSFIDRVKADFVSLIAGEYFSPDPDLIMDDYHATYAGEGAYNESYIGLSEWLVTDRVFVDNVEIADLFHWNGDKLFIIHNKLGYGVTVRDVCSQILHSMQIIDRLKDSGDRTVIGDYYDKIATKYYTGVATLISKDDFIDKIIKTKKQNITYVLGYVKETKVNARSRSNIAKFESVKLCNTDRKAFDFSLKIVHIPQHIS